MKNLVLALTITLLASTAFAKNSEEEREDKKYFVTLAPLGLEFETRSASIDAGIYLDSNSTLSLQYTQLLVASSTTLIGDSDDRSDESQELWDDAGKGFALSINYKKFVTRTFYLRPSIYYRSQKIVISTSESFGSLVDSEAGSIHDSGLSFRIGNQWQWSKLTIGCDWVGVSQLLVTFDRSGNLEDDNISTNLSLLNAYVGMSF